MPDKDEIRRLLQSPELSVLNKRRFRVVSYLSAAMFIVYGSYFLTIAFLPDFMGKPLFSGRTVSNYIWSTIFIVLFSVFISAYYSWWANKYFDSAQQKLLKELSDEE